MPNINTAIGTLAIEAPHSAKVRVTGVVKLDHGVHYNLDLTLHHGYWGYLRRSYDDLILTFEKDGRPGSFTDRERSIDTVIEPINAWLGTPEGLEFLALAQEAASRQVHDESALQRVDL